MSEVLFCVQTIGKSGIDESVFKYVLQVRVRAYTPPKPNIRAVFELYFELQVRARTYTPTALT